MRGKMARLAELQGILNKVALPHRTPSIIPSAKPGFPAPETSGVVELFAIANNEKAELAMAGGAR